MIISLKNTSLIENNEIENIQIMMQYDDGTIVNLSGSRDSKHGYDQRVEVFGNFGMYKLENQIDNNISYYDDRGSNYSKMNYSFKQRYKEAYIKELDYMYKMIVNDYEPLIKESHLILTKQNFITPERLFYLLVHVILLITQKLQRCTANSRQRKKLLEFVWVFNKFCVPREATLFNKKKSIMVINL